MLLPNGSLFTYMFSPIVNEFQMDINYKDSGSSLIAETQVNGLQFRRLEIT